MLQVIVLIGCFVLWLGVLSAPWVVWDKAAPETVRERVEFFWQDHTSLAWWIGMPAMMLWIPLSGLIAYWPLALI